MSFSEGGGDPSTQPFQPFFEAARFLGVDVREKTPLPMPWPMLEEMTRGRVLVLADLSTVWA